MVQIVSTRANEWQRKSLLRPRKSNRCGIKTRERSKSGKIAVRVINCYSVIMAVMASVVKQHEASAPQTIRCAVVTISDTRTLETDSGGATVVELLERGGHVVAARTIIRDEPEDMRKLLRWFADDPAIDAVLMTGGTGITSRDQTYETVSSMLTKQLPGYGEVFRMLSYHEVGPAAILSRAIGGLIDRTVVLTMPGSPAAVQLAMEKIVVFQLNHLVREARR